MILARAGPEYAILTLDSLIGNAGVVGDSAGRGAAQFGEDGTRLGREESASAQTLRDAGDYLQIRPNVAGRRDGAAPVENPAFEVSHSAFFFGPLRGRKHHVGALSGFGEKEVGDGQKVE